ncbi:putative UDP-glucuronate 4-epimerase [Helianthus annuus]|nr:putative UDP-glucuronate 4-epimerase [Helianthus annuus]KAJ0665747.1 putative UDP-glucuronate 4-epimerase [Helianthus annuus]KAJ0851482.1 putative UDP-glucuronate 4-epimerase [Helianthus annuus]
MFSMLTLFVQELYPTFLISLSFTWPLTLCWIRLNWELCVCIGDPDGKKTVNSSVNIRSKTGYSVLGIRAASFVGIHVSTALKCCVDYVLWLDNCNNYYDPTHKRASTFVGK